MRTPAIATLLASLLAAGCAASSPPDLLPSLDPTDPALGLRSARYAPVLGDFEPRQPTGPENWRDLNDRLSPANREQGS